MILEQHLLMYLSSQNVLQLQDKAPAVVEPTCCNNNYEQTVWLRAATPHKDTEHGFQLGLPRAWSQRQTQSSSRARDLTAARWFNNELMSPQLTQSCHTRITRGPRPDSHPA